MTSGPPTGQYGPEESMCSEKERVARTAPQGTWTEGQERRLQRRRRKSDWRERRKDR